MTLSKGRIINWRASTAAELVRLREALPEIEKQARKTPPKTLLAERAKVDAAKASISTVKETIAMLAEQYEALKKLERTL